MKICLRIIPLNFTMKIILCCLPLSIRDRKNIDSTCLQMTKQNVSAILAQMEIHRILKQDIWNRIG